MPARLGKTRARRLERGAVFDVEVVDGHPRMTRVFASAHFLTALAGVLSESSDLRAAVEARLNPTGT